MFKRLFQTSNIFNSLENLRASKTPLTIKEVEQILSEFCGGTGTTVARAVNRATQQRLDSTHTDEVAEALILFEKRFRPYQDQTSNADYIILLLALIETKLKKSIASLPKDNLFAKICALILAKLSIEEIPSSLIDYANKIHGAGTVAFQSLEPMTREQLKENLSNNQIKALLENQCSKLEIPYSVSTPYAQLLATVLQNRTMLTSLKLSTGPNILGHRFDDIGALALANTVTQLVEIDISYNRVGDAGVITLINQNQRLTSIKIAGLRISDVSASLIAKKEIPNIQFGGYNMSPGVATEFSKNTTVRNLGLDGCLLGDVGFTNLCGIQLGLVTLSVRGCQIGENAAKMIANLTSLNELYLENNLVSGEGLNAILQLQKLTYLEVARNGLKSSDYILLNTNTTLRALDLGSNAMIAADVNKFALNTTLETLILKANNFKFTQIQPLSSKLKSLDVSFNYSGSNTGLRFVNDMQLTRLDASYNTLRANGIGIFAFNTTLRELILGENDICKSGFAGIARNRSLTHLTVKKLVAWGETTIPKTDWLALSAHPMLLQIDIDGDDDRPNVDEILLANKKRYEDMAILGYLFAGIFYHAGCGATNALPIILILKFALEMPGETLPKQFATRVRNGSDFFVKKLIAAANKEAVEKVIDTMPSQCSH